MYVVGGGQPLLNKGFTLIELLAVIIILAIIALIAIPQVLNLINDSKKKSAEISVQNYLRAVEVAVMNKDTDIKAKNLNGTYEIEDNGKQIVSENNTIDIEFDGQGLAGGYITIQNNKVVNLDTKIDKWYVILNDGIIKLKEKQEKSTLVSGQKFNVALKKLVNKNEEIKYDTEDTSILSIEFYSNGILPSGYTSDILNALGNENIVDVSEKQDKSIMAYNDNGKVYIISDNLIEFNQYSIDMFNRFIKLDTIQFRNIDTKNVTSMTRMFYSCNNLKTLDAYKFDTSSVTSMSNMFSGCSGLTTLDVEKWDTAKVIEMQNMFNGCNSLTKLDVSKWDTSSVGSNNTGSMFGMFYNCTALTSLDVSRWDTSKVTSMSNMFSGCSGLNKLDVSNWNTGSVTSMSSMFQSCSGLTELDVSNWNTSKVTSMFQMFTSCSNLISLDLSNWDTSKVLDMKKMFYKCNKLINLNVTGWDTSSVGNDNKGNMEGMFYGCSNLNKLDVSNWNTSNVTSMYQMFRSCSSLTNLNLSNWNTSNVTSMNQMFWGCKLLKPIFVGENFKILETSTDVFTGCATENEEQLCEPNSTEEWCVVSN